MKATLIYKSDEDPSKLKRINFQICDVFNKYAQLKEAKKVARVRFPDAVKKSVRYEFSFED